MRQKLLIAISGVIAGSLFWAGTASAATVDLEYSLNDGVSYVALASGADITSGSFSQIEASATGVPPLSGPNLLATSTIDVTSSGAPGSNTLIVLITETGLTGASGSTGFASGLSLNSLTSAGATVVEKTYLDPGNGAYALTDLLSSATYSGATGGQSNTFGASGTVSGPYSVTAEYIITLGPGQIADGTIDISTTPIPGTLLLLATGLGLLGITVWSRRKKMARSVLDNAATA